jgi:hypothetical protein
MIVLQHSDHSIYTLAVVVFQTYLLFQTPFSFFLHVLVVREHVTFAKEYLYSSLKTLYLRAFNHLIAKALKLCTFKSDMLPFRELESSTCFLWMQSVIAKVDIIGK